MTHEQLRGRLAVTVGEFKIADRGSAPAMVGELGELTDWGRGELIVWTHEHEDGELAFTAFAKPDLWLYMSNGDRVAVVRAHATSSALTPEDAIADALVAAAAAVHAKAKQHKRTSAAQLRQLAKAGGIRS